MPKSKPKPKTASVLTVGQMIESIFGNMDINVVNFKMLQTVLTLLARQMRLLNRQVALETESPIPTSDTNIVISEIKIKGSSKKNSEPQTRSGNATGLTMSTNTMLSELDLPLSTAWSSGGNSVVDGQSSVKSEATVRNLKYYQLLAKIEEHREKVLRVINQRKNSRDTGVTSPSPMISMASTDVEFEKLLLVENILEERKTRRCLPLVTRDLFDDLTQTVQDLQIRLDDGNFGNTEFPDNMKLMQDLRRGASLTEAMAALQISARLEAIEKTLQRMKLCIGDTSEGKLSTLIPIKSNISQATSTTEMAQSMLKPGVEEMFTKSGVYVTKEDFQNHMQTNQAQIIGKVNAMIKKVATLVDENTKQSRKLEMKLRDSLNVTEKIQDLDRGIISTKRQLNTLDTGLTSQMTNLQEQLTQLQLNLESGIENMTETLANKGVDTEMLSDLNRNFANLKIDIERTSAVQRDITDIQKKLAFEINRLQYEVELLRDIKCDRDEVIDALRDKAGIVDLNGLVTNVQFEATNKEFAKEIEGAYTTFRKQEITWQKAINDIFNNIDEKVDKYHVNGLRDDICENLNKLKNEIDFIKRILGEPLAASVTRSIYRDTVCLSCANPAHITPPEGEGLLPPLNQPTTLAETKTITSNPNKNQVLPPCVAGLKITHTIHPRAEICTRYCGGSHTKKRPGTIRTSAMRLDVKPLLRPDINVSLGTDGKTYQVEQEENLEEPCIPCNQEYGAGEGTIKRYDIEVIKSSFNSYDFSYHLGKRNTSEKLQCGESLSIPRCSNTPSVPPMMDQLSGTSPLSAPFSY